jgi:hypothetical protein
MLSGWFYCDWHGNIAVSRLAADLILDVLSSQLIFGELLWVTMSEKQDVEEVESRFGQVSLAGGFSFTFTSLGKGTATV